MTDILITSNSFHESVARHLSADHGQNYDFAWIADEAGSGPHRAKTIWWAGMPKTDLLVPSSAMIKLIQGIFDNHWDQSFFLLRNRIWTTAQITSLDRALVRVTAKRCRQVGAVGASADGLVDFESGSGHWIFQSVEQLTSLIATTQFESHSLHGALVMPPLKTVGHLRLALEILESKIPQEGDRHDKNRKLAALLLDPQGRVLWASQNLASRNKTLHAETHLCQSFYKQYRTGFPDGSCLIVSLKPCRMCAEMISVMSHGAKNFKVVFRDDDLGPLAQNTVLQKSGVQFQLLGLDGDLF